jgi:hypothetical protein
LQEPPEGFILNYTLLIGDLSFSNFQKVLDIKGTPKNAQNHLQDTFLTMTSTRGELASTSFLTSLDMDPQAHRRTGSDSVEPLVSPPLFAPIMSADSSGTSTPGQKRDVFADVRKFVSFGLRRDSTAPV